MNTHRPDADGAIHYALQRLQRELPATLVYHNLSHTKDDVLPAAEHLAWLSGIEGEALDLLRVAATFHDIGFIYQHAGHELISIDIAAQQLPRFGFIPRQIETVAAIILATRLPQSPTTSLEALLADADLDVLGRDDYAEKNQLLRQETAEFGEVYEDCGWYRNQLNFLEEHRYFTVGARALRQAGHDHNLLALSELLASC